MAYFSTATAPERRNVTEENRVWDFFRLSNETHPANRRQPAQPRRIIRPTPTKTASGIPYWPSRDPIGERGGRNLCEFVGNCGLDSLDYLGREEQKPQIPNELSDNDYLTLEKDAVTKLSNLCENKKCLGSCGCSEDDCKAEAKKIAKAAIQAYRTMANHPKGWGNRPGNTNNDEDIHRGWMCFQWQYIMYTALKEANLKCFKLSGSSYLNPDGKAAHNWVNIVLFAKALNIKWEGDNVKVELPPKECLLRLDAWAEYAPKLYTPDEHSFSEDFVTQVPGEVTGGLEIDDNGNAKFHPGFDHSNRWPDVLKELPSILKK